MSDRSGDAELAPSYSLDAQDAAEALIALGWPIQPHGHDMECWRIGELIMTDEELIGLATRRGIRPASEQVQ
ncbi:hypothetical protein [Methylobacterium sp. SD21]|uniref:hypothetical protein n=1 Tax=Methylobacterium litchii TaxID=3138810 RepID=UPI00313E294F